MLNIMFLAEQEQLLRKGNMSCRLAAADLSVSPQYVAIQLQQLEPLEQLHQDQELPQGYLLKAKNYSIESRML